jgi:hypothetical protein
VKGGPETCVHPLTQYVAFKLRKCGEDVKRKLTARSSGVDVFGERMELNPALVDRWLPCPRQKRNIHAQKRNQRGFSGYCDANSNASDQKQNAESLAF